MRVGACQTPEIIGDIDAALRCIIEFAQEAEGRVDLLLFPECFLQGYIVETNHLSKYAIEFDSSIFNAIIRILDAIEPILVFGVIEKLNGSFFNSAVVIQKGELKGVYRKTNLTKGEALFEKGKDYPIFEFKGVKYGINICYDTNFSEASRALAKQGAELVLVPAQNMMRRENAEKWRYQHNQIRAERAKESGVWLISADVTGEREGRIAYGPTSAINPKGEVVEQVPLMKTGMIVIEV